jgi:hypothetical protein
MRKSICSIVLVMLAAPAAPAAAQPGQTPVMPSEPPPPTPQPMPAEPESPYAEPMPPQPEPPYGQPMPPQPMPQQQPTRATFVSMGDARWDVRIDNNAVCSTPCSLLVDPMRHVTLHAQDRTPDRLAVGYLPPGDVLVQARPRAHGAFAAGVTFTSLSGLGLVTGITLTAVGCSTDRGTMCNAGLITGGVSAVGLYLSIDLIRRSLPRVYVGPAQATPYATGNSVGLAGRF